jgi:hypothetical protein
MFYLLSHNPFVVLYLLQAGTYCAAAKLARRWDHRALSICYLTSAFVYGRLGVCHLMYAG